MELTMISTEFQIWLNVLLIHLLILMEMEFLTFRILISPVLSMLMEMESMIISITILTELLTHLIWIQTMTVFQILLKPEVLIPMGMESLMTLPTLIMMGW